MTCLSPFGSERQVWSGSMERWSVHYCGLLADIGNYSHDPCFREFLGETFRQTDFTVYGEGLLLAHVTDYPSNEYVLRRKGADMEPYNGYTNVPPTDAIELGLHQVNHNTPVCRMGWNPLPLRLWADWQEEKAS